MTRRTSNNYSGPRYLFSTHKKHKPVKLTPWGSSRSLKSSAPFTRAEMDAAKEPHVDNEGYEITR